MLRIPNNSVSGQSEALTASRSAAGVSSSSRSKEAVQLNPGDPVRRRSAIRVAMAVCCCVTLIPSVATGTGVRRNATGSSDSLGVARRRGPPAIVRSRVFDPSAPAPRLAMSPILEFQQHHTFASLGHRCPVLRLIGSINPFLSDRIISSPAPDRRSDPRSTLGRHCATQIHLDHRPADVTSARCLLIRRKYPVKARQIAAALMFACRPGLESESAQLKKKPDRQIGAPARNRNIAMGRQFDPGTA